MSDKQITAVAGQFRKAAAMCLEADVSPGVIAGAMMRVIYDLMKAQEMTDMQISNQLTWLVDEVREEHYKAAKH